MRNSAVDEQAFVFADDIFFAVEHNLHSALYDDEKVTVGVSMITCRTAAVRLDISNRSLVNFAEFAEEFFRLKSDVTVGR